MERCYRWMVRQNFFRWWYLSCNLNSMKKQDLVREMKIKTRMRYHLIPVRMAIIKKQKLNTGKAVEKEKFVYCCGNVEWCSHYGSQYRSCSKN